MEYGAIEGSSNSFNSRNFKAASIGSALNILDNVTKQPKNPAVVSFSKYTGPEEENLDAATPILLLIAKVFGNFFVNIEKKTIFEFMIGY